MEVGRDGAGAVLVARVVTAGHADAPKAAAPLAFEPSIGADGVVRYVIVVGSGAPPESVACLRSAFEAMVFHPPNFAPAKVRYPFVLGEP